MSAVQYLNITVVLEFLVGNFIQSHHSQCTLIDLNFGRKKVPNISRLLSESVFESYSAADTQIVLDFISKLHIILASSEFKFKIITSLLIQIRENSIIC